MAGKKKKKIMKVMVIDGDLNVREAPSITSKVVRVLKDGTEVEISGLEREWYKIDDGFIMMEYTMPIVEDVADVSTCDSNLEDAICQLEKLK